jgi:ubiquitin-activating enzyme E1
MMSCGVSILFNSFMNKAKKQERLKMSMREVVFAVTKKEIPADQKYLILEVIMTDIDSGDELELPYIRFKLHS